MNDNVAFLRSERGRELIKAHAALATRLGHPVEWGTVKLDEKPVTNCRNCGANSHGKCEYCGTIK